VDVCLNVRDVDPVVTQLMLLCCVNPFGGKGGATPRSVFGRFSGVKGCCAIAARQPGPSLTPEPRRPLWGSCWAGQGLPPRCAASRRRPWWMCRSGCWGWVRGGEETEDLAGDVALEDTHDFFGCSAFGSASGHIVTGCLVVAHPHQHDRGQYPVQLSVASPVQPISDGVV
jgi:hypothetical protein